MDIFCIRVVLKNLLPLTDEHFVFGSTPANLRLGLDLDGQGNIDEWHIPLSPPRLCHRAAAETDDLATISDHHSPAPQAFIYEFVEVGPIN